MENKLDFNLEVDQVMVQAIIAFEQEPSEFQPAMSPNRTEAKHDAIVGSIGDTLVQVIHKIAVIEANYLHINDTMLHEVMIYEHYKENFLKYLKENRKWNQLLM